MVLVCKEGKGSPFYIRYTFAIKSLTISYSASRLFENWHYQCLPVLKGSVKLKHCWVEMIWSSEAFPWRPVAPWHSRCRTSPTGVLCHSRGEVRQDTAGIADGTCVEKTEWQCTGFYVCEIFWCESRHHVASLPATCVEQFSPADTVLFRNYLPDCILDIHKYKAVHISNALLLFASLNLAQNLLYASIFHL